MRDLLSGLLRIVAPQPQPHRVSALISTWHQCSKDITLHRKYVSNLSGQKKDWSTGKTKSKTSTPPKLFGSQIQVCHSWAKKKSAENTGINQSDLRAPGMGSKPWGTVSRIENPLEDVVTAHLLGHVTGSTLIFSGANRAIIPKSKPRINDNDTKQKPMLVHFTNKKRRNIQQGLQHQRSRHPVRQVVCCCNHAVLLHHWDILLEDVILEVSGDGVPGGQTWQRQRWNQLLNITHYKLTRQLLESCCSHRNSEKTNPPLSEHQRGACRKPERQAHSSYSAWVIHQIASVPWICHVVLGPQHTPPHTWMDVSTQGIIRHTNCSQHVIKTKAWVNPNLVSIAFFPHKKVNVKPLRVKQKPTKR